jgi:cytosine/adenosine deaminase-related metal-dependent hydrolase
MVRFGMGLAVAVGLMAAPAAADTLIRDLRVVDVEAGLVGPPQDMWIADGMIAALGPPGSLDAAGTEVFDAGGGYAIPGLWDAHVHVFSSPAEAETALPAYVLNGVTGIRDMGAILPLEAQRAVAVAVEAGERIGPRIILSGAWVDAPPGSWPGMFLAGTPEEARARVREIKALGYPAVKTYSMLSEPAYLALVDEAKALGLPVVGHLPESVTLATAIAAGQSGLEHWDIPRGCSPEEGAMVARVRAALTAEDPREAMIAEMATHNRIVLETFDEALCARVLADMARARLRVTPTLIVADFYTGKRPVADDVRMTTLPAAVRAAWDQPDFRLEAMTDELRALADASIALDWQVFRMAHEAGVPIIAGTDASYANPFIFHGFSLLDELDRYVEAGLTPQAALFAATVAPPRFFGLADQDGRLVPGRRADLVILARNPLEGLQALRDPVAVIAHGRVHDRAALGKIKAGLEEH